MQFCKHSEDGGEQKLPMFMTSADVIPKKAWVLILSNEWIDSMFFKALRYGRSLSDYTVAELNIIL